MILSLANVMSLVQLTLKNPRQAARLLIEANVPISARWMALGLTAALSAILAHVSFSMIAFEADEEVLHINPVTSAIVQCFVLLGSAVVMFGAGRLFRGTGRVEDALLLTVWLQFVLLMFQVLQIVTQMILPPLSAIVGYSSIVIFLWLISNFAAELHRFSSALKTFFGVLATMILIGMALASILVPMMEI